MRSAKRAKTAASRVSVLARWPVGLGEVTHLAWIDGHSRELGGQEQREGTTLKTTGCLEDDEGCFEGGESGHEGVKVWTFIRGRPGLVAGKDMDVQPGLGDIYADKDFTF
jgi:hypothetical protein